MAQVEQAEDRLEILLGHADRFIRGTDRVVEADAGVPDRVPDLVGQGADVAAPGVDDDQIEIGVRRRFAPAEPADRDQRQPVRPVRAVGEGQPGEQLAQPSVVGVGQGLPQGHTDKSGLA